MTRKRVEEWPTLFNTSRLLTKTNKKTRKSIDSLSTAGTKLHMINIFVHFLRSLNLQTDQYSLQFSPSLEGKLRILSSIATTFPSTERQINRERRRGTVDAAHASLVLFRDTQCAADVLGEDGGV